MKIPATLFLLGGIAFAVGLYLAVQRDTAQYRHELDVIRERGAQGLKPSMAGLCSNYFEWSNKYGDRVQNMERICGEYLTR